MNDETMTIKEEAILFAKEKIEDASEAISEFLPDMAEELNWFSDEMGEQLTQVRSERLAMMGSALYSAEACI